MCYSTAGYMKTVSSVRTLLINTVQCPSIPEYTGTRSLGNRFKEKKTISEYLKRKLGGYVRQFVRLGF